MPKKLKEKLCKNILTVIILCGIIETSKGKKNDSPKERKCIMKKVEKIISSIATEVTAEAVNLIAKAVEEQTGRKIEIISLNPFEFRYTDKKPVYHICLFEKSHARYKLYRGREEFCLRCRDYGMKVHEYGKEVKYNDVTYKIVGFAECEQSGYFLLMGKCGGLYVTRAKENQIK